MHLVTGASDNHYKSLINMILSFMKFHKNDPDYVIIVYNLGIKEELWTRLLNIFSRYTNFIPETFDYSQYPDYVNININAGEYAWKPIIIHKVFNKYKDITLWMDAGNIKRARQAAWTATGCYVCSRFEGYSLAHFVCYLLLQASPNGQHMMDLTPQRFHLYVPSPVNVT
jgi:hypothetical protein